MRQLDRNGNESRGGSGEPFGAALAREFHREQQRMQAVRAAEPEPSFL